MGDKRTDPGHYYPGGRVRAKSGTAPQELIVQWSDVQGKPQIAPLPDRYRESDMKGKINEIASKFATVVVAALIGWTACADITVQKKRKDQIYNDEQVVVDVTGGGGSSMTTNAVIDIIHKTVDGAARPLPKYLHERSFNSSYPDEAQEYYRSRGDGKASGGCSAVRDGNFVYRNFDYPFDDRAEFVVKMSAGPNRFASIGVAQVGTNLTEQMVTSGKPSRWYKALPGATVDGINENGVVAEINVVDTPVTGWHTTGDLHPLAAVRWVLDNSTNAYQAATYIAANIRFPQGWAQNFHYMVADAEKTYIVENGTATDGDEYHEPDEPVTMTNFQLSKFPWDGMGMERFGLLLGGSNITNAWYTNAYRRETNPPWVSDLADVLAYTNEIFNAWASRPKEYFRNKTTNGEPWWQTVHTSVYDITNRILRVAVQETDDWYVFAVPSAGGTDEAKVREIASEVVAPVASSVSDLQSATNALQSQVSGLASSKRDLTDFKVHGLSADYKTVTFEVESDRDLITGTYATEDGLLWENMENGSRIRRDGASFTLRDESEEIISSAWTAVPSAGTIQIGAVSDSFNVYAWHDEIAKKSAIAAANPAFSNAVLAVAVSSLSTNITEEVYIAATNACANLGIDPALIPQGGTIGTVGGLLLTLAAAVALLRKKTQLLDNEGKATDDFATDLLEKPVAINFAHYAKVDISAVEGTHTLLDRTINRIAVSGNIIIAMPSAPQGMTGSRDFALYLKASAASAQITLDTTANTYLGDDMPTTAVGGRYIITFTELDTEDSKTVWLRRVADITPKASA